MDKVWFEQFKDSIKQFSDKELVDLMERLTKEEQELYEKRMAVFEEFGERLRGRTG